MPKRLGNLYPQCFTMESLYSAYERARQGKRKTRSVMLFERDLGANLNALYDELSNGGYRPQPYKTFMVTEPKPRKICAPAFRDVVVQHAIYRVINPIFDRGFVADSYGCRVAKGTHRASDRTQWCLRHSAGDSYVLQLDIRKFYYNIDRGILRQQIERKIKDSRLVDLMMLFADDGVSAKGVPIGNLLSQLYALVYLDQMDHFIKRELKAVMYVRYVDDFILFNLTRIEAVALRLRIEGWLAENLRLELSHWTIQPTRRGVNFVGFRTWRSTRYVRKHSLYRFSKSLRKGDVASLNSIIGNARKTSSLAHFRQRATSERPDIIGKLSFGD